MKRSGNAGPGIREVAKTAGVSVATASRVMAKTDYPVAAATKQKVQDAARELGFVPNAVARNLARSKTDTIGVVVPGIINPYYAAMVEAIDRTAREHGLRTLLGLTGGDEARREEMIEDFLSRRADGLIICAGAADHYPGRTPEQLGIPAVLIGEQANTGFPIVKTDNHKAGYLATEYLWSLGHRRFTYLTTRTSWHDFHQRGEGMFSFLRGTGETFEVDVYDGLFGEADTYTRMAEACSNGFSSTAILASTDRHALGALAALSDAKLDVPSDVSVVGFDDYVTSGFVRPALTTIQMPAVKMASTAVALLAERIEGREVRPETLFNAGLIQRGSTSRSQASLLSSVRFRSGGHDSNKPASSSTDDTS